jgi:hypothetical protein
MEGVQGIGLYLAMALRSCMKIRELKPAAGPLGVRPVELWVLLKPFSAIIPKRINGHFCRLKDAVIVHIVRQTRTHSHGNSVT